MKGNLKMDINMVKVKWFILQKTIMKENSNLIKNKDTVLCIGFKTKKEYFSIFLLLKITNFYNKFISSMF